MKWLSLFSKIIGGLILGLFIATVWFGHDERCAVLAHNTLQKTFKEQFGAHFHGRVQSYTFFPLAIEFVDVSVYPLGQEDSSHPDWWWKADSMKLHLSLLSYLYSGFIDMYSFVQGVVSYSAVDKGYPLIMNHITSMTTGVDVGIPVALQAVSLLDVEADFVDRGMQSSTHIVLDGQVKRSGDALTIRCSVKDGNIRAHDTLVLEKLQTKTVATLDSTHAWTGSMEGAVHIPLFDIDDQQVTMQASWYNGRADIKCYNNKRTLFFTPLTLYKQNDNWHIEAQGTIPLYCLSRVMGQGTKKVLEGALNVSVQGSTQELRGVLSMHHLSVYGTLLPSLRGTFHYHSTQDINGTVDVQYGDQAVHGTWQIADHFSKASCSLENTTDICKGLLKYWYCKAHHARLRAVWDKAEGSFLEYDIRCDHQKLDAPLQSTGRATLVHDLLLVQGIFAHKQYEAKAHLDPAAFLSLTYTDPKDGMLGQLSYDPATKKVQGSLRYEVVSQLMTAATGLTLPGSGLLQYKGYWHYPVLEGSLEFAEGVVRVSGWYNFISALKGALTVDMRTLRVTGKDCSVRFHKGVLKSDAWNLRLDPWHGITWAHIPWSIKNCFVNWKKDLYAVLSGSFILQKEQGNIPSLSGFLSLDRSQFRANILSTDTQRGVIPFHTHPFDMALGVHVFSEQPIEIITSPLETKAAIALDCIGTLRDPALEGKMIFSEGMIHFPAHSLNLVRGSLTFLPTRLHDPLVELIAQNRIKKYLVTVSVSGTAQDPHIALDASPPLSEQQILMLLLGGSEEESLKSMVPALLMRNIEAILFGPQGATLARTLPTWLEPLRKVTFVPQFTDQSARGGFKGAIEIEVSKRLRAVIEKNFSLTEDTAVKVDYLLSNDVSLRAIRDARGDLGAAIEMRLKF